MICIAILESKTVDYLMAWLSIFGKTKQRSSESQQCII